jgi:hypothetical protein
MTPKAWADVGFAILLVNAMAFSAAAATSFSNPLTGFTGNSTLPATQGAVAAAGLNFFSTSGLDPDSGADPTVQFDSSGATFGGLVGGDGGRNYMRTIESDYANTDFVAEVTIVVPDQETQDGFFGLGAGDTALFGWPDWSTQFSSVILTPEVNNGEGLFTTMYTDNDAPIFANNALAMSGGTHRLRLALDRSVVSAMAVFSVDLDYTGGAFMTDYTAPALDVSGLYGLDGWSEEPSRIFFGGDDGTLFKDFQVSVSGTPVVLGDLNSDGAITSLDWVILRTNQETDLSGLSLEDAYFRGDLTADRRNSYEDFNLFKALYDANNGAGSFVDMQASVPEPGTLVSLLSAGIVALPCIRRGRNREST